MKQKFKGTIYLLLATVIWGSAFIAQSIGMDHIGPFTFQAVRAALAACFLLALSWVMEPEKAHFFQNWKNRKLLLAGTLCGAALFLAAGMQQVSLQYTTAGKAGFITTLYIVMVPILGLFLGTRPPLTAWVSVGLATAGMYLLSGTGQGGINRGDLLLLCCAFWFAVHITMVDKAAHVDGIKLSALQSAVCAILSGITAAFTETLVLDDLIRCTGPLLYAGVLSMGVAYTLQILGQKNLPPTPAALIMSLESVFALIFGWLILHERLSPLELAGCALVLCAVILSQLPTGKDK